MITRQTFSLALIVPACMCLVGAVGWFIYSWGVTRNSVRTMGTVTQLVERHYDDVVYCPVFVFRDTSGVEHTIHSFVGSNPPRFPIGSTVSILYRSQDPSDARIEDRFILWTLPAIMVGLSVFYGGIGFMIGRWPRKKGGPCFA